jgi:hypothetical protein
MLKAPEVLAAELDSRIEDKVRAAITERILRVADFEAQVVAAIATIEKPTGEVLAKGIGQLFARERDRDWRDHIEAVASFVSGHT